MLIVSWALQSDGGEDAGEGEVEEEDPRRAGGRKELPLVVFDGWQVAPQCPSEVVGHCGSRDLGQKIKSEIFVFYVDSEILQIFWDIGIIKNYFGLGSSGALVEARNTFIFQHWLS